MARVLVASLLVCIWMNLAHADSAESAQSLPPERRVAITVDDLPAVQSGELRSMQRVTSKLLQKLERSGIRAVGFVNEGKIYQAGDAEVQQRTALLAQWLKAGHELGNHTYSHADLNSTSWQDYRADVIRGESITLRLLQQRSDGGLRYFRHPYLRAGKQVDIKKALEAFLKERGYEIAPVTIDNSEWIYAAAYAKALAAGAEGEAARIGADYVRYMDEVFGYYERLSVAVLGREIPQILLIHANQLNAQYFDELAEMMKRRGYSFVPLAQALQDAAYAQPDPYIGPRGLSWLQRWAIGMSLNLPDEPAVADFVTSD